MLLNTALGPVRGLDLDTCSVFYGIPFAAPPVGDLRWRAPRPHPGWEGVLEATAFPPMAPQADVRGMPLYGKEFYDDDAYFPGQSEDCLYLNIWKPKGEGPFPVAVWFHGGAFDHGYGYEKEFGGEAYAARGVLLVTAAYRLGPLGFFGRPDGEEGLNFGLMDQTAALRWVRDHISDFGGDADNVTIFGQSAGAMSVQCLCSEEETAGLFRRAILQSGAGMADGGMLPTPQALKARSAALVEALGGWDRALAAPAEEVLAAADRLPPDGRFAPALEKTEEERWETLRGKGLDFLLGACADDMTPGAGREGLMYQGALTFAQKAGEAHCRLYYFDHPLPGSGDGAFHSAELWYTFSTYPRCWRPWTEEDKALAEEMTDAWTAFMKTGTPENWPTFKSGFVREFK